jgi:hypothetical protein
MEGPGRWHPRIVTHLFLDLAGQASVLLQLDYQARKAAELEKQQR